MKIAAITPYQKPDYLVETIIEGIYKNGIDLIGLKKELEK